MKSILKRNPIKYRCDRKNKVISGKTLVGLEFLDYLNIFKARQNSPKTFVTFNENKSKIVDYVIKTYKHCFAFDSTSYGCFYLKDKVRCNEDEYSETEGKKILERKMEKRLMHIEISILRYIKKQFVTNANDISFRIDQLQRHIKKCDEMV